MRKNSKDIIGEKVRFTNNDLLSEKMNQRSYAFLPKDNFSFFAFRSKKAIKQSEVFPKTEIQLCIVHQIRNSLKYIVSKEQKSFMADLKLVYKASSQELAEHYLLELGEKWNKKYPAVIKSWNNNWDNLSQYFKYPEELRRLIYTTNIVEGFHRQIRKYTKNKGAFTSENALLKLIYCACQKVLEKWSQPMHNWALIISQLQIYFEGRLNLGLK